MLKRILYGLALGWLVYGCYATSNPLQEASETLLSVDEMQEDLSQLLQELKDKHAGLHRYQSKEQWKKILYSSQNSLNENKSLLQFYQEISRLVTGIQCGHTKVSLPDYFLKNFLAEKHFLPFECKLIQGTLYIHKSLHGDFALPKGTAIIEINGKKVDEIIHKLQTFTSTLSDGANQTGKIKFIENHFAFCYSKWIAPSKSYQILYKTSDDTKIEEITVKGIALSKLKKHQDLDTPLQFDILKNSNTAILKLSSFDQSFLKQHQISLKDTLPRVFGEINRLNLKNLVFDLRGNTGGDDAQVALLLSYLIPHPFKIYEKIETNPSYQSFGTVERVKNQRPQLRNLPGLDSISPQNVSFKGKLYTLIDGMTFSGASDAAAILASHQRSVFYGEETGGAYQGNNSGIMPAIQLKNSKLSIRIPLWQYSNAVNIIPNHQGGVVPDYRVDQCYDDYLEDIDTVLKTVIQEIDKKIN